MIFPPESSYQQLIQPDFVSSSIIATAELDCLLLDCDLCSLQIIFSFNVSNEMISFRASSVVENDVDDVVIKLWKKISYGKFIEDLLALSFSEKEWTPRSSLIFSPSTENFLLLLD